MPDETEQVEQLTEADLKGMDHHAVSEARKAGKLESLLAPDPDAPGEEGPFTPSEDAPGGGHEYGSVGHWLRSLSPAEVRIARSKGLVPGVPGDQEIRNRRGTSSW